MRARGEGQEDDVAVHGLGEDVTHESVVLHDRDLFVLKGRHAGRLLTTMLQGKERVVAERRHHLARRHYPHDATGFFHSAFTLRALAGANTDPVSHRTLGARISFTNLHR